MPDIFQDFPIKARISDVFRAVSSPAGLDQWWTQRSAGSPTLRSEYELWFGPEYDWRAVVSKVVPDREFELTMTRSDGDWNGSRVGFVLEPRPEFVWVRFYHLGWPETNEHFRISNHCWAMYLRVLRRFLEHGETVPYAERLDV